MMTPNPDPWKQIMYGSKEQQALIEVNEDTIRSQISVNLFVTIETSSSVDAFPDVVHMAKCNKRQWINVKWDTHIS